MNGLTDKREGLEDHRIGKIMSKYDLPVEPMKLNDIINNEKKIKMLDMPLICGVYFLIQNNEIVYVGQSKNISSRVTQHTDKLFDSIMYIECSENKLYDIEKFYIIACNPKYNETNLLEISRNAYRIGHKRKYGRFQRNGKWEAELFAKKSHIDEVYQN